MTTEMTVSRVFPSGAWRVASIVGDYLVTRTYFGYTKREAVRLFRADLASDGAQ